MVMAVFLPLLFLLLSISCSETGINDVKRLQERLNKGIKSEPLPDSFKFSSDLFNGLTPDGAKTLFEIILGVDDYDKYKNEDAAFARSDASIFQYGLLTPEHVLAMQPKVCVLFADYYEVLKHPEQTPQECTAVFLDNLIKSRRIREHWFGYFPASWAIQRPIELIDIVGSSRWPKKSVSQYQFLPLENLEICGQLTFAKIKQLEYFGIYPSSECFAKTTDLASMELSDLRMLERIPQPFLYYNGRLSQSVTHGISSAELHDYASMVEGEICQNLNLEFVEDGIIGVTVQCLHGYFLAESKPLDIGKIPKDIVTRWISKFPSDFQHIRSEYFNVLHYSCWQHILGCKSNLTKDILKRIFPENVQKPAELHLSQEHQELIKSNAPTGFFESIQTKFSTESLLGPLNKGSREISNQIIKRPCGYPDEFYSGLDIDGARTLLCVACDKDDYTSLLTSDQNCTISLKFTDLITPEQVAAMKPTVCAVFLHALQSFSDLMQTPESCWKLYLDELIEHEILAMEHLYGFPHEWFSYRTPDLFILFRSKGLEPPYFHAGLVETAIRDPEACSRMKLDYFRPYSLIIPPECVARLSDLATTKASAFKNLGPDAFSLYDGPLSGILLQKLTKEQLTSFGVHIDKPKVCSELCLRKVSMSTIQGITKQCLAGYFSKPAEAIETLLWAVPIKILLQWMEEHPQDFRNVAMSDRAKISQHVWTEFLISPEQAAKRTEQLFKDQDDIGLLDLPSYGLDESHLRELLGTVPLLAHALIVRATTLPVNLYDILGPEIIKDGITVCHQKRAGIHFLAALKNVKNASDIIAAVPIEFCQSLRKGEYLRYSWLRLNFSAECRKHLPFQADHSTPELEPSNDPDTQKRIIHTLKSTGSPPPGRAELEAILSSEQWFKCTESKSCIKWSQCEKDNIHYAKGRITARGQLKVPSNYRDPEGGSFTLTIYRYTQRNQKPRAHLLFLNGGPGGPGVGYREKAVLISELTRGDTATYLVDHRGLGESGQFTETGHSWITETLDLKSTLANKKFDEKDLQLGHAALDVGMVGLALQNAYPASRCVTYGFSYGALWAYEAARLIPDLFDSIILGGMPALDDPTLEHYTLQSILDHCKLDPFCSSKMGVDIDHTFPAMVKRLGSRLGNRCVKEMRLQLGISHDISSLSFYLAKFTLVTPSPGATWANVQVLLPFVKATIECTDFTRYVEQVLVPLKNAVQKNKQDANAIDQIVMGPNETNSFVNKIINFSISNANSPTDRPELHPYYHYESTGVFSKSAFCKFCLAGQEEHESGLLSSQKTAIIHMQGLFDVQTSYRGGKEIFDSTDVPSKIFQPVNNRGHGLTGPCETEYIISAVYGHSTLAAEQCFEESNKNQPIKWEFAETDHPFKNIWSMVKEVKVSLPTVEKQGTVISSMEMPTHAEWIGRLLGQDLQLEKTEDDSSECKTYRLRLPVNYKRSVEKRFEFQVWECGQLEDERSSGNHVILLTDSAEYLSIKHFEQAKALTQLGCVVYLSQYRGLKEYDHLKGVPWNKTQANELKAANLSGEHVSNDVALLAMAIQSDPSRWCKSDKLIFTGTDLGAQIGYNVAAVFPNLFDAFILCNVFGSKTDFFFDIHPVIDLCVEDPVCLKLIEHEHSGMDATRDFIKNSISALFTLVHNDCSQQLYDFLEPLSLGGDRLPKIHSFLATIAAYDSRLIVPFAVITQKCKHPELYTQLLHGPISDIFANFKEASVSRNDFVDSILRIDVQYQCFGSKNTPPIPHLSYPHWSKHFFCYLDSSGFKSCLPQKSATLQKGKMYMIQSDLYPNVPPAVAKMLYDKTEGSKVWIPLRHAPRNNLWPFVERVLRAEIGEKSLDIVQECKTADDQAVTDWEKVWRFEM